MAGGATCKVSIKVLLSDTVFKMAKTESAD